MSKSTKKKKTKSRVNKVKTTNQRRKGVKKSSQKKTKICKKNSRRNSSTRTSRKYLLDYSSDNPEVEAKKIILPQQLFLNAKVQVNENSSITCLRKAMKVYDIDEKINYYFFEKCKKITRGNFKYLYTLNYEDRQKIIKKHKLKQNIFLKSSKIIFILLIKFLINTFEPKDKKSFDTLKYYKLQYFGKYIIPISEGNEELKYYYFIDIVLKWLKKSANRENISDYLSFFEEFFENE